MARRWRLPARWTRTRLWQSLVVTALAVVAAVVVALIWGAGAAWNVSYFWGGVISLILTNDTRPAVRSPAVPKVRT